MGGDRVYKPSRFNVRQKLRCSRYQGILGVRSSARVAVLASCFRCARCVFRESITHTRVPQQHPFPTHTQRYVELFVLLSTCGALQAWGHTIQNRARLRTLHLDRCYAEVERRRTYSVAYLMSILSLGRETKKKGRENDTAYLRSPTEYRVKAVRTINSTYVRQTLYIPGTSERHVGVASASVNFRLQTQASSFPRRLVPLPMVLR